MVNERARELRNNATAAERRLWYRLRVLNSEGQKFSEASACRQIHR
ncbi:MULTISPECIES: DUF559 domain-containing protein [unclassified Hyphomicrobium]|nr:MULTISPECIES: DUF559 domain-containing protein [unclassified Hyphomicrobium]